MARETNEERRLRRLEEQRLRSAALRAKKAENRTPERDDFARELLHFAITENLNHGREVNNLIENLIVRLVARGFDRGECERVIVEIMDRYEAGWQFQRKIWTKPPGHLDEEDDVSSAD